MSAEALATKLSVNSFAGIALIGAVYIGLPIFVDIQKAISLLMWVGLVLTGAAALALSIHLLFDALLFRLFASYESEDAGGVAVDRFLVRAGLRKQPDSNRTLAERMAGTTRLLNFQRAALLVFLALFVFMAAGDFL